MVVVGIAVLGSSLILDILLLLLVFAMGAPAGEGITLVAAPLFDLLLFFDFVVPVEVILEPPDDDARTIGRAPPFGGGLLIPCVVDGAVMEGYTDVIFEIG